MSLVLVLFLSYMVMSGEASPAARRLHSGLDQDTLGLDTAALDTHLTRQDGHHLARRFVFPGSGPSPPNPRSRSRIFFPGNKPSKGRRPGAAPPPSGVTSVGNLFFPGEKHDTTAFGEVSQCDVGANLKYTYEGTTWTLLSRGQCPEGEWAVMVQGCQPGCRPIPCPPGQLEHRGKCVNLTDPSVCGRGQVLYVDQRGKTFCDCENDRFYFPWDGQCYARRERGPCNFGFYMDLNENGNVDCMPNDCMVDEFVKDSGSGKCFRKDYVGFCPDDRLEFNHQNQTVKCTVVDTRNIFDNLITTRSCSPGSGRDHSGNCRPEFVVPTVTTLPRSLTSGCHGGTISVRGCRRVSNYFS